MVRLKIFEWIKCLRRHLHQIQGFESSAVSMANGRVCLCSQPFLIFLALFSSHVSEHILESSRRGLFHPRFNFGSHTEAIPLQKQYACSFKHVRHLVSFSRSKGYFASRVNYYSNSDSSFHQIRLIVSGDISENPGPENCAVCLKTVAPTHRALSCDQCDSWCHMKCGYVTPKQYREFQQMDSLSWICPPCLLSVLPFANTTLNSTLNSSTGSNDTGSLTPTRESEKDPLQDLVDLKREHPNQQLLFHLNINSLQSKFDELKVINSELKAGIIVLTETKIDSSYTNAHFSLPNHKIYRQKRAKGSGGVLTYITSQIPSKKLRVPFVLELIEVLVVKVELNNTNAIILGLYRPPRCRGTNYYAELEKEFNKCLMWATMQFSTVIIMRDLNMDKLKVNGREAKLLRDIEEVFELTCLVTEPTRITDTSQTLLDVLLTNQPDLFKNAGVSDIGLSGHCMVYGFLKETVKKHTADIITCRSFKNLDMEEFKKDLEEAVWFKQNVTEVDKLYDNWYTELMRIVDKHLPLKRVKARKIDVPYMTGEWKEAIRKKRKYAKKFSQNKTKENMELMKKWRNNATRLRRKAIKNYWNAICEDMNNNSKNSITPLLRSSGPNQKRTKV